MDLDEIVTDLEEAYADELPEARRQRLTGSGFRLKLAGDERGALTVDCRGARSGRASCSVIFERLFFIDEGDLDDLNGYLEGVNTDSIYRCRYDTGLWEEEGALNRERAGEDDYQGRLSCDVTRDVPLDGLVGAVERERAKLEGLVKGASVMGALLF